MKPHDHILYDQPDHIVTDTPPILVVPLSPLNTPLNTINKSDLRNEQYTRYWS